MKKINLILTILIVIVLLAGLAYGYFVVYKEYKNELIIEAFSLGYNKSIIDIAQGQTLSGSILVWRNETVQLVSIADLCSIGGA
jgi:flagellar basal body-associated protein FliL